MLSHNNMWKWEISGNIYHFKKNILNLMAAATLEKTLDWGNKRVESRKVKNFSGQTIFLNSSFGTFLSQMSSCWSLWFSDVYGLLLRREDPSGDSGKPLGMSQQV